MCGICNSKTLFVFSCCYCIVRLSVIICCNFTTKKKKKKEAVFYQLIKHSSLVCGAFLVC